MPSWHVEPAQSLPDFTTLVLKKRMEELLEAPFAPHAGAGHPAELAAEPPLVRRQGRGHRKVNLAYGVRFGDAQHPCCCSEIEVTGGGQTSRYQLPFGFIAEDQVGAALPQQLALSRVRRGPQVGLITDAFSLESFIRAVLQGMQNSTVLPSDGGEIRFEPTAELAKLGLTASPMCATCPPSNPTVRWWSATAWC